MSYTANDIETLNFRDAVRTRIEMYMGSADNQGVLQCIREIISNSIDEFSMGYGNKIQVELFKDNRVKIVDWARGCPFGKREDGTEAMEAIFMSPHSGGKFGDKIYQSVIGLNGIGCKGVALSSSFFEARSRRNGEIATLTLRDGFKENFKIEKTKDKGEGTSIEFVPSSEVYRLESIKIDFEDIKTMCKNWSYLNAGLTFTLINHIDGEKIVYKSDKGIIDLLKDRVKKSIHSTPIHFSIEQDGIKLEVAAQWTRERERSFVFTNGLHNVAGGTTLTGAKTAITRTMNNISGKSFTGEMARTGLIYVMNAKIPNASFSDQTKTKVNNPELRSLADKAFTEALKDYAQKNVKEFEQIVEFLSKEEKAELAAERARQAVLNSQKEIIDSKKKKVLMPDKLKDAEKLGEDSILLLVEGNSAASSMANSRDYTKYGILALRGKVINALSNSIEKVLQNEEVKTLMMALGVSYNNYNPKNLRYGKIAICVDSDDDGAHIACLIMALIHKLIPQFLEENRLYWLKAPLFKVVNGNKIEYYFSEEELKDRKGGK